ncbi:hypothetical protein [Vibrio harveyi]|uniref:hypothetical protein n=1 Tax=Vibrio harveyi TaxID=669 RepID=UPI0002C48669|nr:integrase/transposase [Vibrio harveyi CAIM 1792]
MLITKVLSDVREKLLRQVDAAYPAHKSRDRPSNRRYSEDFKVVYLIEPTEENTRLVHEHVKVLIFDKLEHIQQAQIVDNKRLGQVLKGHFKMGLTVSVRLLKSF